MTEYIERNDCGKTEKTSTIKMNISFHLIEVEDNKKYSIESWECINDANTFSKYYKVLYIMLVKQLVNKFKCDNRVYVYE